MKKSPLRILLVGIFNEKSKEIIPILKRNNYNVDAAEEVELAVQRITNEKTDLVISSTYLNSYYGFEVFKYLKPVLFNAGIPFIMVLEEFDRDDVLIGLEMGIDNFLFLPFLEPVVIHSIENLHEKKSNINLFETHAFKHYFYTTSVAMFFKSEGKISLINDAFCQLIGSCGNQLIGTPVAELFLLHENETNKLNYKRFKSGLSSECYLKNVKCIKNNDLVFDITFFKGKSRGINNVFAEMVTSAISGKKAEPEISKTNQQEGNSNPAILKEVIDCEIRLTEREKQVYMLSAQGMALKQIANKLNLSQRTVEKHRANIMQKTHTSNFIETMVKIGPGLSNLLQK